MSNKDDILNSEEKDMLSEARLLAYFEGRLSPEEQHEVELLLSDEGMDSDAVEGLNELSAKEMKLATNELKHRLNKELKNTNRRKGLYRDQRWTLLAIFMILILCVLGFIVIRTAS